MGLLARMRDMPERYVPVGRVIKLPAALHGWKVSLDGAGLVALADLTTVQQRTALTGTSCLLDALVLSPGLHRQQHAPELNGGEYPACAAMTTGYIFRVENQATVAYLQKVGRTAQVTTLSVENVTENMTAAQRLLSSFYDFRGASLATSVAYMSAVALTLAVLVREIVVQDWWAVVVIVILIAARAINTFVIRRRAAPGWFGAPEPGVKSDLLVLLSQDRWMRIQGATDDVKAITAGQWLGEPTFIEGSLVALATLLVYLDAALAGNAGQEGKLVLLVLLFSSVALLGLANQFTDTLTMHGRRIKVKGKRKPYDRRLALTQELIKEFGRTDCFVGMGMTTPEKADEIKKSYDKPVVM